MHCYALLDRNFENNWFCSCGIKLFATQPIKNFILKQHTLYTKYFTFFHSNTLKSTTKVSTVGISRLPFYTRVPRPFPGSYQCGMVCISMTHMGAASWNLVLLDPLIFPRLGNGLININHYRKNN